MAKEREAAENSDAEDTASLDQSPDTDGEQIEGHRRGDRSTRQHTTQTHKLLHTRGEQIEGHRLNLSGS